MGKIIDKILNRVYGRRKFQPLFQKMHGHALKGQNFYNAATLKWSGEEKVIDYIKNKSSANTPIVLFDVGATNGDYSEYMATQFAGKNFQIHLFEPTTICWQQIKNKFLNNSGVFTNKIAIGNKTENIQLYCCTRVPAMNTIYDRKRDFWKIDVSFDYTEVVPMTTVDVYCEANNITHIDFLKLDTEGNELDCIDGAMKMIEKNSVKHILFEFGGANIDSRTYFYDFWSALNKKYNIFRVLVDGLQPIKEYSNELEVFVAVNYFAELKEKI